MNEKISPSQKWGLTPSENHDILPTVSNQVWQKYILTPIPNHDILPDPIRESPPCDKNVTSIMAKYHTPKKRKNHLWMRKMSLD